MWRVLLAAGAVLLAGVPVLNALTTSTHLGVTLVHGPIVLAGFDLTVLALGIALGAAAWMMGKRGAAPVRAGAPRAIRSAGEVSQ